MIFVIFLRRYSLPHSGILAVGRWLSLDPWWRKWRIPRFCRFDFGALRRWLGSSCRGLPFRPKNRKIRRKRQAEGNSRPQHSPCGRWSFNPLVGLVWLQWGLCTFSGSRLDFIGFSNHKSGCCRGWRIGICGFNTHVQKL